MNVAALIVTVRKLRAGVTLKYVVPDTEESDSQGVLLIKTNICSSFATGDKTVR